MRVKRSEASRTRMETYKARTRMATAFSNVLNNTSDSLYADTDTLDDAEDMAAREAYVTKQEEDRIIDTLRGPLTSADLTSHNAVAVSSSAFGLSDSHALNAQDIYQPSSFVKQGAHVLSGYTDAQLDSVLDVLLRGDNSEAVFHCTGEDLKRLLFRKLTTLDQKVQMLENLTNLANGRIDAIERYGNR